MDIYLDPDTGQQNINCDPERSDFNTMVLRTRKPQRYYEVKRNGTGTGPDLIVAQGTDPTALRKQFQEALAEISPFPEM